MNKRIRELDQQAVDYANNVCDANGIYKGKEYLTVVKEKFAELIVQDVLDEVLQAMDDGMDVYDTVAGKFGVDQ